MHGIASEIAAHTFDICSRESNTCLSVTLAHKTKSGQKGYFHHSLFNSDVEKNAFQLLLTKFSPQKCQIVLKTGLWQKFIFHKTFFVSLQKRSQFYIGEEAKQLPC